MGASIVKWIAHDPCLELSWNNDSKLYTNFESYKEKFVNIQNVDWFTNKSRISNGNLF